MADDFVAIINNLTNFVQNERTASFNEGLNMALKSIKDFMRIELKIDPSGASMSVPDLLYEIQDHYERTK